MGEHQHEQIKKTEGSHKADEATTTKAKPVRIAAAPQTDFGDLIVGETAFREIHVFNQDRDLAFLDAHIEGGDAFQITSKPTHVNPSANGFDPTSAIRVAYMSRSRKVDRGVLVATLRWRDGTSESLRIALHGAAHRSNELTHEDEQTQNAAKQEQQQEAKERELTEEAEEERIRAAGKDGGSYQRPIMDASDNLGNEIGALFGMQQSGVTEASERVATYQRRLPPPPPPDVVMELAMLALQLASGGIASVVAGGINAAGAGWTKGKRVGGGLRRKRQSTPGSKELSVSPADPVISLVVGKLLAKTTAEISAAAGAKKPEDGGGSTAAESRGQQIEYFAVQRDAVVMKQRAAKSSAIDLRRSLIHFDNPTDAPATAEVVDKAAAAIRSQLDTARSLQSAESMKGWIRHVSHSSMGSVTTQDAQKNGLKETEDGTATAKIARADASRPYDGVIELEFDADLNHATKEVQVASARLYGVANAAVASLGLTNKALRTARLPIRARSTSSSSPVAVTIARDEAGNVRFTDESGAAGLASPWLSRRGGKPSSESAAQRAAKNLIDGLAGKTLTQLGVTLETDGTDV